MLKILISALVAVVCLALPAQAQEKSWQKTSAESWRKSAAQMQYNMTGCNAYPRRQAAGCRATREEYIALYTQLAVVMETWDRAAQAGNVGEVVDARIRNLELGVKRAELLKRDWVDENFSKTKWVSKLHGALSTSPTFYKAEIKTAEAFIDSYCKGLSGDEQKQCTAEWNEYVEACEAVIVAADDRNTAFNKGAKEDYYDANVEEAKATLKAIQINMRNKKKYFGENSASLL